MAVHVLDAMAREGFEEVLAVQERRSGLRAFLGIHDTSAGPAFGGVRRFAYRDEKNALIDCLRLARAMTHKCALAGVAGGGGKTVVLARKGMDLARAYRHLGRTVERFGGRYYAGPDVGTGPRELGWMAEETDNVTSPGDDGPGDLAGATASGVFSGMAAALRQLDGEEDWPRRTIVVQGVGGVGELLARRISAQGARVLAADQDPARVEALQKELDVEWLEPGTEIDRPCDVFAPCAMGGMLHDLTIQRLQARIVCGAANNVLAHQNHGNALHERGILYVPDFVVNAGAVIRGAEFHLSGRPTPLEDIESRIGTLASEILHAAVLEDVTPVTIAQREAELRIEARRGKRGESSGPGRLESATIVPSSHPLRTP